MSSVRFFLNDRPISLENPSPTQTLLRWLRDEAQLTGTKEGCAEGDCGACTVAWIDDGPDGKAVYRAVNSCLILLPMVHGRRVYTVEGLQAKGRPHPVQEAMVRELGSQCGYCTPGFVMSMFEACYREDLKEAWQLDDQLAGNLCRCTGYRPIRDAAASIAGLRPADAFSERLSGALESRSTFVRSGNQEYSAPNTLAEIYDRLSQDPTARVVSGATDLGLDVTQRHIAFPLLVSTEAIPELRRIEKIPGGWRFGAGVVLADLEAKAGMFPPIQRMLRYFAARPIKNRATLGGNLCNASPIGDLPPVMLALGAVAVIGSAEGERKVPFEEFFVGYRKTAVRANELLIAVEIPDLSSHARYGAYKVSRRRELDISAVAAAMVVEINGEKVISARLAYGGMAATPKRAPLTEAALIGKPWTEASIRVAADQLAMDFSPIGDHRATAEYRSLVARNLLIGFQLETAETAFRELSERHAATVEIR